MLLLLSDEFLMKAVECVKTGVGFPEMGPQQPAQLGVAGIDLRALERQCAVIPLPGGENEISGHI